MRPQLQASRLLRRDPVHVKPFQIELERLEVPMILAFSPGISHLISLRPGRGEATVCGVFIETNDATGLARRTVGEGDAARVSNCPRPNRQE
jgi:hypothetical protein